MAEKKRNTVIDFAKGIGILLVILDHTDIGGPVTWWRRTMNSFYMPMFVILSGLFFKEEDLKVCAKKRFKTLVIPYFCYGMISVVAGLINHLYYGDFDLAHSGGYLLNATWEVIIDKNSYVLYFLPMLFITHMLYAVIVKISKGNDIVRWILVVAISTIGWAIPKFVTFVPWHLDLGLLCVFFFAVGHEVRRHIDNVKTPARVSIWAGSAVLWVLLLVLDIWMVLALRYFGHFPLCIFGAVLGTCTVVGLCFVGDKVPLVNKLVRYCGVNTLTIMCINNVIVRWVAWDRVVYPLGFKMQAVTQAIFSILLVVIWNFIKKQFARKKA